MQADLVRLRRLELGLSRRAVAREVGLSEGAIARLEAGAEADDWTLRQLRALSAALALDVVDVLAAPTASAVDGEEDEEVEDVIIVGALLARCRRLTPTSTLAHATGWELARVNRALRGLDVRARDVGQRLHRVRGSVALRPEPGPLEDDALERLLRQEIARSRLNRTQVAILRDVRAGTLDEQRFGEADRVAYASLVNAGLVGESVAGPVLTEAASFSLPRDPDNQNNAS